MRNLALYLICLLTSLLAIAPSSASATAGSPPKNLRVTGVTDWTVGLRWDAPKGNAPATYVIQSSTGATMIVPGTQTSATFSNGFDYNRTYTFRAFAVTGSSWSTASNSVTATLLRDTTPPTKPILSTTGNGPTHIDLAWSVIESSPNLRTDVYINGLLVYRQVPGASKPILMLRPNTSYTFTVQVRDFGGNWSPMSDPFTATTPPANPNDNIRPSTPPNFSAQIMDEFLETSLFWGHSTDNVTSQDYIEYHVFLNGVFDGGVVGTFHQHRYTVYLEPGVLNTIEVFARDEAGNLSIAASAVFDLRGR
jgi:hypothetical protein